MSQPSIGLASYGGDGEELNLPSTQAEKKMYYRHSRCFRLALLTPIGEIRQRLPSGLR